MVTQRGPELPEGIPRQPGHRARAAARAGLGHDRRREDGAARERRAVPQPARQRERPRRDGAESAGAEHAEHHLRHDGHAPRRRARRARSRTARATCSASSATRRRRRATTTRSAFSASSAGARCSTSPMPGSRCATPRWRRTSTRCPTARGSSTSIRRTPIRRTRPPPSRAEFLRPYLGYQDITIRSHFGTAHYNSLQVQLNRRYINGLQFAVAYTSGKTVSDGTNGTHRASTPLRPGDAWNEGPDDVDPVAQPGRQLHVGRAERQPDVEQRADARPARRLAAVRRHRVRQRRLGRRRASSTTDNFDFTGGDGGTRPNDQPATALCTSGNCDPTPGGTGSYFNVGGLQPADAAGATSATRRVTFYRLPKIVLSNMSIFKNFQLGGGKPDSVPLGGLQRVQPGELVDASTPPRSSTRGRAGQRELRPGDRGPRRHASCRGRFGSRSEPRTESNHG